MGRPLNITDDAILDTLTHHPEVTSAEIADTLGIGQSTAGKRLAALETAGSVRRTPGGRSDGRRVADRWAASASPGASQTTPPTPADLDPAAAEPELNPDEADVSDAEPGGSEPATASGEADAETNEADSTGLAADATGKPPAAETGQRLGRGELGSLVRDYLAAHPGESFGPSAVGKVLGRSQGAISNSLSTMAAKGEVELVGDKPRRYRIAATD